MNSPTWRLRRFLMRDSGMTVTAFRARIASKLPEAQFQVTIQTGWPRGAQVGQLSHSLAEQHLLRVAQMVASEYSVLDSDEARAEIDLQLFRNLSPEGSELSPVAAWVSRIDAGPEDQHLAERHEGLRRQTALAQLEQTEEVKRLRMLGDQVLADPTLASLWWLDGKPDRLEELIRTDKKKVFENVADLFSAVGEGLTVNPIAQLIRIFLEDLDGSCRQQLIKQLTVVFRAYERHDLAGQLDSYRHPADPPSPGLPSAEHATVGDSTESASFSPAP